MSSDYRVQLDVFSGPLDLLLYLIRRDELDIQDIAIARVTDQYVEYVKLLEALDPNTAGDFLVLAATLIEMKSRALLPTPPLEPEDDSDDPRATLVRELLEYKRFKDAATKLGSSADERAKRYVRAPVELPPEAEGVELEDIELWDVLSAFGRLMNSIGQGPRTHDVTYDDTPIEVWRDEIVSTLERRGARTLQSLFENRTSRAEMLGLFLALLELIRGHRVRAEQNKNFGIIYISLRDECEEVPEPPEPATPRLIVPDAESQSHDEPPSTEETDEQTE
ncbi:MAG: segregation/condensation protein A [Phycisphaerae bacterium]|nr:segregation/condensation protein A [Phycisphaerae bacterium]